MSVRSLHCGGDVGVGCRHTSDAAASVGAPHLLYPAECFNYSAFNLKLFLLCPLQGVGWYCTHASPLWEEEGVGLLSISGPLLPTAELP